MSWTSSTQNAGSPITECRVVVAENPAFCGGVRKVVPPSLVENGMKLQLQHCERVAAALWTGARRGPLTGLVAVVAGVTSACVGIAAPATTPPRGLRENTPAVHALVGAKIVIAPGRVIERGTIVLRNGEIVAVGADVPPPADARVWKLDGKTIYPGFIDAYTEIDVPAAADQAGGGYWNRNIVPHARAGESYNPDRGLNRKLRSQGITARLVAPSIRTTPAVISFWFVRRRSATDLTMLFHGKAQ